MTRAALAAIALLAITLPVSASGQTDGQTYSDPAMSFTAPSDFSPLPVPSSSPDVFAQPTVVAAYVRHPKQPDVNVITITMENTQEDLASYEQDIESKVRGGGSDSVFVKKELTTLPNGMPAYFLDITMSQEASEMKTYDYVWVDRLRGVVLSVSGRFGTVDDRSAKKDLGNVSAVAYPRNHY